ncbi:MAG: hypothetical protein J5992_07635 [Oscillospiraceae bacterium]|nr:hypothetical protein [Oscillospiraceae bacterium]
MKFLKFKKIFFYVAASITILLCSCFTAYADYSETAELVRMLEDSGLKVQVKVPITEEKVPEMKIISPAEKIYRDFTSIFEEENSRIYEFYIPVAEAGQWYYQFDYNGIKQKDLDFFLETVKNYVTLNKFQCKEISDGEVSCDFSFYNLDNNKQIYYELKAVSKEENIILASGYTYPEQENIEIINYKNVDITGEFRINLYVEYYFRGQPLRAVLAQSDLYMGNLIPKETTTITTTEYTGTYAAGDISGLYQENTQSETGTGLKNTTKKALFLVVFGAIVFLVILWRVLI